MQRYESELRKILEEPILEDPDFKYQIERRMVYESAEIPVDSLIANVLRKYAAQISEIPKEPFGTIYFTDVRNFIRDAKIPAATFGPGDVTKPIPSMKTSRFNKSWTVLGYLH